MFVLHKSIRSIERFLSLNSMNMCVSRSIFSTSYVPFLLMRARARTFSTERSKTKEKSKKIVYVLYVSMTKINLKTNDTDLVCEQLPTIVPLFCFFLLLFGAAFSFIRFHTCDILLKTNYTDPIVII